MNKNIRRARRIRKVREKTHGTKDKPRLSVYRSNTFFYAQLIDDEAGKTLLGMTEKHVADIKGTKTEKAKKLGLTMAKNALDKKITIVIFDRGGYKYHGRVKSFAEGMREGGVKF